MKMWIRKSGKTWAKKEREREVVESVFKRKCVNTISVEAFDIFSPGEMLEWDSCGVAFDCELEAWSSELVSSSVCVPSSSAVELVGDCDPSDSSWKFVSECGPVAGSAVLCCTCWCRCGGSFCGL